MSSEQIWESGELPNESKEEQPIGKLKDDIKHGNVELRELVCDNGNFYS